MSTCTETTSRCNWILAHTSTFFNEDIQRRFSDTMELGPQNLREIHPAVRTFERFGGSRASKFTKFTGPRGTQKKHSNTSPAEHTMFFFNTPIQGPLKPIYVVPWATLLTICKKKRLQETCLKSGFEGLLAMSRCAGSDSNSDQK